MPSERKGPKGISDLIVRLLLKLGKCLFNLFTAMAIIEKAAPIQKDKMTAAKPLEIPKRRPKTAIYLTSPIPIQRPLEMKNNIKNGSGTTTMEAKRIKIFFTISGVKYGSNAGNKKIQT